jgi:hypothetical protein
MAQNSTIRIIGTRIEVGVILAFGRQGSVLRLKASIFKMLNFASVSFSIALKETPCSMPGKDIPNFACSWNVWRNLAKITSKNTTPTIMMLMMIRGGHNSTSFEFELACKLFPFSMVYRFQKHKVYL